MVLEARRKYLREVGDPEGVEESSVDIFSMVFPQVEKFKHVGVLGLGWEQKHQCACFRPGSLRSVWWRRRL